MLKYYDHLLTEDECKEIKDEFLLYFQKNLCRHELGGGDLKNSYGYFNLPTCLKYTSKIENRIKNDYGKNIVFVNNYIRVYLNDSTMGLHVDRDNLQITLSLNIFSNLDFDYPLYISNTELNPAHLHNLYNTKVAEIYKKDFTSWNTLTGSGVACLAQKYPHWRDDLFCRDDQMMIQAFFHWHYL